MPSFSFAGKRRAWNLPDSSPPRRRKLVWLANSPLSGAKAVWHTPFWQRPVEGDHDAPEELAPAQRLGPQHGLDERVLHRGQRVRIERPEEVHHGPRAGRPRLGPVRDPLPRERHDALGVAPLVAARVHLVARAVVQQEADEERPEQRGGRVRAAPLGSLAADRAEERGEQRVGRRQDRLQLPEGEPPVRGRGGLPAPGPEDGAGRLRSRSRTVRQAVSPSARNSSLASLRRSVAALTASASRSGT